MRAYLFATLLVSSLAATAAAQVKVQEKATVTAVTEQQLEISKLFTSCTAGSVKAKATIKFGANFTSMTKESGTAYLSGGCKKYVVDIKVSSEASQLPSTAPESGPSSKWLTGIFISADDSKLYGTNAGQLDGVKKAGCNSFKMAVTVYKKAEGSDKFEVVDAFSRQGEWQLPEANVSTTGWCKLKNSSGNAQWYKTQPPASGTDIYRVAISSTMNSKARKVKLTTGHQVDDGIK